MKNLKDRIGDLSLHLQSLMAPDVFPEVEHAVEKNDRNLLVKACEKAKIPKTYLASVTSLVLSVTPDQKWPTVL